MSAEAVESKAPEAPTLASRAALLRAVQNAQLRQNIPEFCPGDTIRVHARIVEGNKERVQIFEGVVIKRRNRTGSTATFTVRKVSYNVGVERTFFLHSPRIDKIEVTTRGEVRRAKLFYLRDMKGKAGKVKSRYVGEEELAELNAAGRTEAAPEASPASAPAEGSAEGSAN